ncbi:MAG: peptidase, partial [Dechloromonas sp.]|nr:peptidase [Dechloromonas sp.]
MKRLLFLIHRWSGVALALFMVLWFFSGLLIVYASQLNQTRVQQWAKAEILAPESRWLSLGETLQRSGAAFAQTPTEAAGPGLPSVHEARLVRVAGNPVWQVEDGKGQRLALSAIDGSVQRISADGALSIARLWAGASGAGQAAPQLVETLDNPTILRNAENLKPFHRVSLGDGKGGELLISA